MEKALTFEAWQVLSCYKGDREKFDLARVGMIPESEAVRIDWSDPKLVARAGIVILPVSQEHVSTAKDVWGADKLYKYIPRPVPAWTPKLDEPIFFIGIDGGVSVGKVNQETVDGLSIVATNGGRWSSHGMKMKPFNAAYIGKPWDEIPGGVQ